MDHVAWDLCWAGTPTSDVCNSTIHGQTGQKALNICPISRQTALTRQEVCTQTIVRWLKCYHPCMKRTWSLSTELRHILTVYIMCSCDLVPLSIFHEIGSRDQYMCLNYTYELYTTTWCWVITFSNLTRQVTLWPRRWPIFPRVGSLDPEGVTNACAYLEVYINFSLWNMRP